MSDPVLHVFAGPNGAGKTTFYDKVLRPVTHLEFVNADLIAADRWAGAAMEHAYEAAELAAAARARFLQSRRSFVAETVFSHESKVALLREAARCGYRVTLHIMLISEELAVARVADRLANGGHDVPENKVRERFKRLWRHLTDAIVLVDEARVYDNAKATEPYRLVAVYVDGHATVPPDWPAWTPADLRAAGR
ncbi:MAG: AAA family ATPase [Actinobacteria bacterium]|nr:AAA family ATPase [Actinomycetota bacterium]